MRKIIIGFVLLFLFSLISNSRVSAACSVSFPSGNQVKPGDTLRVNVISLRIYASGTNSYYTQIKNSSNNSVGNCVDYTVTNHNLGSLFDWNFSLTAPTTNGNYTLQVYSGRQCIGLGGSLECPGTFTVDSTAAPSTGSCAGIKGDSTNINTPLGACTFCVNGTDPKMNGKTGVWTALGCVNTKPEDFVAQLLGWVIGLGGGIAFLLIVWGGFQIVTSSGNPEKLDAGKEIIVSALTGLLMIIFSVILLHLIGVDILKIPGFG